MTQPTIGFVGLGEMGGPMVRNLLKAGFGVKGYDVDQARMQELIALGMEAAVDVQELIRSCMIVATSLPSSDSFFEFAERLFLAHMQAGQILLDFGTAVPTQAIRLAARITESGGYLVDAPVSGGKQGAEAGSLYVFVGGARPAVDRCLPLLRAVAGSDHITYCGEAGRGQIVKGVNQLMMGLVSAAYLEAISFGVNAGVSAEVLREAIGNEGFLRAGFNRFADAVVLGQGEDVGVKFRELPYFLQAAEEMGFALPVTSTVRKVCEAGANVVIDDHRPAPSYWHELTLPDRTAIDSRIKM